MEAARLSLPDVLEIQPGRHRDYCAFFSRSERCSLREERRHESVRDNHSFSLEPGALRDCTIRKPPYDQAKLVRVTRGSIFDVAVDIRVGSPTFGA
jgi:dTDP-4-dehydrorhamnose 3,5-epimerase